MKKRSVNQIAGSVAPYHSEAVARAVRNMVAIFDDPSASSTTYEAAWDCIDAAIAAAVAAGIRADRRQRSKT